MRKTLAIICFTLLIYCLYSTIGYAMMGFASPTVIPLVADEAKGFFAGNFLWAIVFGVASIALIIILFFLNRKSKKDRNAGKK